MKRAGGLWEAATGFDNLLRAYGKARLGKRRRDDVAGFALELEPALFALQRELRAGDWQPGQYRQIRIYERKPRLISVAPFRDRVVHHALMNHLAPVLDARFLHDSYACRPGKGVHAAVARYQRWARRYAYVIQLDVRSYFASIEHATLKRQLAAQFKEKPLLATLDWLIDSFHTEGSPGRGLPIGNLTSQWFANLYLDGLDHWIKQGLKVPAYLRYVDDLVLLADEKLFLQHARDAIARRLAGLGLELRADRHQVRRTSEKIPLLGYQVSRERRWLAPDNGRRFLRRMRSLQAAYRRGEVSLAEVDARVQSWIGHAIHGETDGLRRALFGSIIFTRAGAGSAA